MKQKIKCALKIIGLLLITATAHAHEGAHKSITIAIIAPVEIPAMEEIIGGFKDQLSSQYPGEVHYIVKNAQGDINIQRSILQQVVISDVDIVVPIGTQPSQMAASMIADKPIIAVAAAMTDKPDNVTGVLDEISVETQISFIHQVAPTIKKITIVHSASDKVFPEVAQVKQAARHYGIDVQDLMMQQLSDLYSISQQIADDSEAIFVLKDTQMVSGMPVLARQAQARHIPVIASDDGSVRNGAAYALGVSERQIGIDGAKVTLQVIRGESPQNIPVYIMKDYLVFVNELTANKQGVDITQLLKVAQKNKYIVKQVVSE